MINQIPFQVFKGKEENILNTKAINGGVWFATDTRKIYYSDGTDFISMGGNSGIYYGHMVLAETPDEGVTTFNFRPEDIDINDNVSSGAYTIPNPNDLIFNLPDNSFYRVRNVFQDATSSTVIQAELLSVAGGGTGGGGGGANIGSMTLASVGQREATILEGAPYSISYTLTATDAAGEATGNGTAVVYVNGVQKKVETAVQGRTNSIDVSDFLALGPNTVTLSVSASIGGTNNITQTKIWNITVSRLQIEWPYNDTRINTGDNFNFSWTVNSALQHSIHIEINDGAYVIDVPDGVNNYTIDKIQYGLTHGAYKCKIYATTLIGSEIKRSNEIEHTIIFVDENRNDTILSSTFNLSEITQYDAVQIPLLLYNPTSLETSLYVYDNGELLVSWADDNKIIAESQSNAVLISDWIFAPNESGEHNLTFQANTSEYKISIIVNELNIAAWGKETTNYIYKLKANDYASNELLRRNSSLSFSDNFDWINGGLKTEQLEDGLRNYIDIKAGTSLTIRQNKLFNIDAQYGKTIKIIFKATKCRNYDALVARTPILDSGNGLVLQAQSANFITSSNSITVPYCEDSYIDLELDVWGYSAGYGGDRYIMTWLDGVPAGVVEYTKDTLFGDASSITFGSPDCDVQLYLFRVYDQHLTDEQHLGNFIADAYNSAEMLRRYNRNDIYDSNIRDISWSKLVAKNPNLKVYLYDIEGMSQYKQDWKKVYEYQQYYQDPEHPELTAQNIAISVQGTSSEKYVISAANLDTDFTAKKIVQDGDAFRSGTEILQYKTNSSIGEPITKYSLTDTSIPVNYFNSKVNVASAEGANNALNQEWYNRFQPFKSYYRSLPREDGKLVRDTMEFPYPGVIFITDRNQTTNGTVQTADNIFKDTASYVSNPYYKMYAICNMGNSKKNLEVFHNLNNPFECCVEVGDNQTQQQMMTTTEGLNENNLETTYIKVDKEGNESLAKFFEFRYPDGPSTEVKRVLSQAWYRLVSWFAENNPNKYPEKEEDAVELAAPETYEPYRFKGYTAEKDYENDAYPFKNYGQSHEFAGKGYSPAEQILKDNVTISTFAGTYTHDTRKRRFAKMLQECEDYLVMDSIVYHYLFIERHTMIDNVAKNTFWSTEDLVHWSLIKDYDNDTADGNDNEGKLTLTYGLEAMDQIPNTSQNVFNAKDSVWFNFIHGLYEACRYMNNALEAQGAWDATEYLTMFQNYQDAIPERCWIYDYHRKYIRPNQVYKNHDYLAKMEGGKKTHQRRQYETYQEQYISSKYYGGLSKNSSINLRGNDIPQGEASDQFTGKTAKLKLYADGYVQVAFGNQGNPTFRARLKRGEEQEISTNDPLGDATIYIYSASNISSLTGLGNFMPKTIDLSSAQRLKELDLSAPAGFQNNNLQSVSLTNNILLEHLTIQNCPGPDGQDTGPLTLDNLTSLKTLDTIGSGFTEVSIAGNAPLTSLKLNAIKTLSLHDLYDLQECEIDYSNLQNLYLHNIDNNVVNSLDIVKGAIDTKLQGYSLLDVDWRLTNAADIQSPAPEDGSAITILNKLLTKQAILKTSEQVMPTSSAEALSGILNIAETAYNGTDSLTIYDYYGLENYPRLTLNFEGANAKLRKISVLDGNETEVWYRYTSNSETDLYPRFFNEGSSGDLEDLLVNIINKPSSVDTDYEWAHAWQVIADNDSKILQSELNYPEGDISGLQGNIIIKPIFNEMIRKYSVSVVYDNITKTAVIEARTKFEDALSEILNGEVIYKDDSKLAFDKTYDFVGFAYTENGVVNEKIPTREIDADLTVYAQFEEMDVHNTLLDSKYLNLSTSGVLTFSAEAQGLKGKIALPTQMIDIYGEERAVQSVGISSSSVINNNQITHIFWSNQQGRDNIVQSFGERAFKQWKELRYVEIPNDNFIISAEAFNGCSRMFQDLIAPNKTDIEINEIIQSFFSKISIIERLGFAATISGSFSSNGFLKNQTLYLTNKLQQLGDQAFKDTLIQKVIFGAPGDGKMTLPIVNIGTEIFDRTGIVAPINTNRGANSIEQIIWHGDLTAAEQDELKLKLCATTNISFN